MLAPGIAGLVGIGLVEMFKAFRDKRGWQQWLLPLSLLATFAIEIVYIWSYSALRVWLAPVMIVAAAAALVLMAMHYVSFKRLTLLAATGCMLASLLASPFYWALTVVMYVPENVTLPYAGPELASQTKTAGMTSNQEALTTGDSQTMSLEKYLVAHYKAGSYLVVSQRADDVAQFIIYTGLPAVAYGGFLGSDNSMTLSKLKELVKAGKITYFLVSGQNGNSNSDLTAYVEKNATLIDAKAYGGSASQQSGTLYYFK
jgi:4-amino-4-deoxy-L-arabinose transferase-like glycosyltransferase